MDPIAAGFWGAFFGTAALMLVVSLAAFLRSRRSVALIAGLSAIVPATFVMAFLVWLPPDEGGTGARVLAHVAMLATVVLSPMLLTLLGVLRGTELVLRFVVPVVVLALSVIGVGWVLEPAQALLVSWIASLCMGAVMLIVSLRAAAEGNRVGKSTVGGMGLLLLSLGGLGWLGLDHHAAWPVHAFTALAGMGFLTVMAAATWSRYSYLLELAEVMAQGPSYDPVTRMRSHSETGQMVGDIFFHRDAEARPVGVLAVCIGNLYALENLHGRAAFNHALFVCAGRLRRCVPQTVDMGRLGDDGFLLLTRSMEDLRGLGELALQIRDRLARPVSLSISREPGRFGVAGTTWAADVGVGVLATSTRTRPAQAVSTVRAMARTAWSYPSRVAFFDAEAGQIAELSQEDPPLLVA
jgi:GGDEF domain-containing protein